MSGQLVLPLLSEPRARAADPVTSKVAAEKVRPGHTKRLQQIAAYVDSKGAWGMTADEIFAAACVDDPTQLSKRSTWHSATSQAVKAGLLVPLGDRKCCRLSINNTIMRVLVTPQHKGN